MFDWLRPYADLLKVALLLSLLTVTFIGGCSHGTGKGEAKRVVLQARVDDLNRALGEFVRVFDDVNATAKANAEASKAQAALADKAVERAEKWAGEYRERLTEVEAEIEEAKRDPDCRRLLESKSCTVLR